MGADSAALAALLQKLAGKVRFAQPAAMSRFGKAASKQISILTVAFPLEVERNLGWRDGAPPTVDPRLFIESTVADAPDPDRIYSDATGGRVLCQLDIFVSGRAPITAAATTSG